VSKKLINAKIYRLCKIKIAINAKHCILKVKNESGKQLMIFNSQTVEKIKCFDAQKVENG
jgi:hypothetical protein